LCKLWCVREDVVHCVGGFGGAGGTTGNVTTTTEVDAGLLTSVTPKSITSVVFTRLLYKLSNAVNLPVLSN